MHAYVPRTAPEPLLKPTAFVQVYQVAPFTCQANQACAYAQDGARATFKPSVGRFVHQLTLVIYQANKACACAQDSP